VLEHVVDTVLYFEGERHHSHRVVRAVKNRFGAISELGVFEMTGTGLRPVPNPSQLFLSERAAGTPGSAVLCCVEGSRPILVEVQALVSTSTYGNARRMAVGIEQNRLSLLLAVLEKRAGLDAGRRRCVCEYCRRDERGGAGGGISAWSPPWRRACAIAASAPSTALFGEVGLSGEIRGIPQAALRIREAVQMGFSRLVMPSANVEPGDGGLHAGPCELVGVRTIGEALDQLIS
jgi:DNA repair protein RadA/Sms